LRADSGTLAFARYNRHRGTLALRLSEKLAHVAVSTVAVLRMGGARA
jgi:hypothetical protein